MNLLTWGMAMAASLGIGALAAVGQNAAGANTPASAASIPAAAAASMPDPAAEGWTGYVRVLKDAKGDASAVRLVTGDKLLAVELNDKARELAKTPKTTKVVVTGSLNERDGRSWLTVGDFKEAVELAPPPEPAPAASTNEPAASTNAPAVAGSNTVAAAATNAPAKP